MSDMEQSLEFVLENWKWILAGHAIVFWLVGSWVAGVMETISDYRNMIRKEKETQCSPKCTRPDASPIGGFPNLPRHA